MRLKSLRVGLAVALAGFGLAAVPTVGAMADPSPAIPAAPTVAGAPDLGPNVYVFTPDMPQSQIQATVNAIADQQVPNQFGTQRYALLFEPGTYGTAADPLIFQVGYYTEVAGLGASPSDVVINGTVDVYNQCFTNPDGSPNCIALDNFWRSLSNVTINVAGGSGCQTATEFWAVSQAAPMRRVIVNGNSSLMDYCTAGPQYASGGFIADSSFSGNIVNGSQQQFLVRNTNLNGWSNGVWNQVFVGSPGAPATDFANDGGTYTTLDTSPLTQGEPFLSVGSDGAWNVTLPPVLTNSSGPSLTGGTTIGLGNFFIATPSTSVKDINAALRHGQNLLLTPGVYQVDSPITVSRADTIVLGLGMATLVPTKGNIALRVLNVGGTKISGLIVDAGPYKSDVLMEIGVSHGNSKGATPSDPTLLQDVFFRIGGATAGSANTALVVNSDDTILDDIWSWRADHGAGADWTVNTADTGLVVNGDNVLAYGLFVEHYQRNEVVWNGSGGEVIFFQNEMPYDAPSQSAWMSSPSTNGYPAFVIDNKVKTFQGYGMGSYSYFEFPDVVIHSDTAFSVPTTPGVQLTDVFTRYLNGTGGIDHVVNETGAAVNASNPGPSKVVSYP